ncbi:carbon starvation protein A [Omnitrophica bacterium]|nr:carbon starvation protein A [Candidatus Omnitrophota bacterium]
MMALVLLITAMICYGAAYRLYGRFLSRHYQLDPARKTPAQTREDGTDFVPAKNGWVLFGHHFSSICGAGPIVGPVLAVAYWGWGVSAIWIVLGAILMGAVADFSSLVMSVRSDGRSIAEVSGDLVSRKVKIYFSIFLWITLVLIIAVFSIFAAKTFIEEPDAVIPSAGLIPTALLTGWLLYGTQIRNLYATLTGLMILVSLLFLGTKIHIVMPAVGGLDAQSLWILILLAYCFIASVVPVQILLQPRDYLASFILFALILIGVVSVFTHPLSMQVPVVTEFNPPDWPQAGPLWPTLFVTIACGAISGFHSLVASGTTCKQIASETHVCRVGYGGMLLESLVGILVLIAVGAGLSYAELGSLLKSGGPISAFSHGYAVLTGNFLGDYAKAFAVLALNAFILTTLDTATRITRYLTSELFRIENKYLATLIVVTASGLLALTGQWNLLWPAFGAANQLIAGIALLLASCWLLEKGKNFYITLIPALLMLVTTIGAFALQLIQSLTCDQQGAWSPNWPLAVIAAVLIALAVSVAKDTLRVINKSR